MIKKLTLAVAVLGTVAMFAGYASAATTTNPANAPNGTHYKSGSATCTVAGDGSVSCSSYTLAGVGNTDATVDLTATYTATVVCVNGGGNTSDSQHQGTQSKETGPIPLTPTKNGNLTVPSLSVTAPTADQFLSQQSCPNPNWTPTLGSAITLSSFDYTLTFDGFSGAYIEITGP
jgi:hypothetical protein